MWIPFYYSNPLSSSLVRMSGFHPVFPGSNPGNGNVPCNYVISWSLSRLTRIWFHLLEKSSSFFLFVCLTLYGMGNSSSDPASAQLLELLSPLFSITFSFSLGGGSFSCLILLIVWIPWYVQRWAIIRKRHGNLNLGSHSNGTQLSEAQLAARHAMSLALDRPVKSLTGNTINPGDSLSLVLNLACFHQIY